MAKAKELQAWRESHFAELGKTLEVLKSIRDDPEASSKDRIEASKSIGRMLSAMSPSRGGEIKKAEVKKVEHKPTEEEWLEIDKRLAN